MGSSCGMPDARSPVSHSSLAGATTAVFVNTAVARHGGALKRLATLLGGDSDRLFRLAESTDPDLAAYVHNIPNVPEFLRTARAMKLTSEDFATLIEEVKRRRPLEAALTSDVRTSRATG